MAGTTNFLQFNPGAANQETDSQYLADSQRAGGAINGQIFNDQLANKLFYQMSTWIAAQAGAMANKGYSPMDTSVSTLQGVLANIVTFADLKTNISTVAFSSNPVFNAASTNGFRIDLAGNVTGSTLINISNGQILTFYIVSGNPGNFSFVWPSNVIGAPNVQTQSSGNLMTFQFISDGSNAYPLSTFLNFLQSEIASLTTSVGTAQTTANNAQTSANAAQTSANLALSEIAAIVGRGPLQNNSNGYYFEYSDGTLEQWGFSGNIPSAGLSSVTVTFPKSFTNLGSINFQCGLTERRSTGSDSGAGAWGSRSSLTTSNIRVDTEMDGGGGATQVWWRAIGF